MSDVRRATLYLRLSETGDDASTSIARQERDLRTLAEQRGWEVAHLFVDDGRSGRADRENALAALATLRSGDADVLAVWKFDRWSRQGLGAVAALLEVLDARPDALFVALQDGLSSETPAWRIIASVLAEVARMESDNTRLRVRSAIDANRKAGRFSGGRVPYGYRVVPRPDGQGKTLEVVEEEAAVLREAAERVVVGSTLGAEARRMNAAGHRGRVGAEWTKQTLRTALTGEHIVGRQMHRGEVLRGPDGLPLQVFPPVLPLPLWRDVRAATAQRPLSEPRRRRAGRLLSGLLYCGECDGPLHVTSRKRGGVTYALYHCASRSSGRICSGVGIAADPLDDLVSEEFLRVAGPRPVYRPVSSVAPVDVERLASLEEALDDVLARLRDVDDPADELLLLQRRRDLRALILDAREKVEAPELREEATGETFGELWADAEVFTRREYLRSALDHVKVAKASPDWRPGRRGGIDPERVTIQWAYTPDDRLLTEDD